MANQTSASLANLPSASSPTLKLIPATVEQARQCWGLNGEEWRGPLTQEAYIRREQHLGTRTLTRDGGATYWILVDTASDSKDPVILSACESYRKTALVARRPADNQEKAEITEVVSHGIGSVFCRNLFRGKGYAGRMMDELRANLQTWQQPEGQTALFNVLYSDIGRKFYAKRGWIPFPSDYVLLTPKAAQEDRSPDLPQTRPVLVTDLDELCTADERQLRKSMADFSRSKAKVRVAFRPDRQVMEWQHSREEFIGNEFGKSSLGVKGAVVHATPGKRTWCIWTRQFDHDPAGTILYITRIATEVEDDFQAANGADSHVSADEQVKAIAACLSAAQEEAARMQLKKIDIWNPSANTLKAVQLLNPGAKVVQREETSIASLLWYGSEIVPDDLEWVSNEKYGWC